jgi:PAS domain S-box-containing protein
VSNADRDIDPSIGTATQGRVGRFRFFVGANRWQWSDAVARKHGYEPDMVVPTTELAWSHKHPEDSAAVSALLDRVRPAAEPFASRYRIITAHGETRWVVVAADRMYDRDGQLSGFRGSTST